MPEYLIWKNMRARCSKPYSSGYYLYGERGITVCEEWSSFAQFIADMGTRPSPQHSIDRIDNSGPYCKENCRWATRIEQARNKRNSVRLVFKGKAQSMQAWAEELGLTRSILKRRRDRGWDAERILTTPRLRKLPVGGKS